MRTSSSRFCLALLLIGIALLTIALTFAASETKVEKIEEVVETRPYTYTDPDPGVPAYMLLD